MTARAPLLGSTISQALGLTFLHVNTTRASREASLLGAGIVDADRSCRINRNSIELITIGPRFGVTLLKHLRRKRQILVKI
jgi:hypothetical protein